MTASAAKAISDNVVTAKNNANLTQIETQIETLAERGYEETVFYSINNPAYQGAGPYMSTSAQSSLVNLGYTLNTVNDPDGLGYTTTVIWGAS